MKKYVALAVAALIGIGANEARVAASPVCKRNVSTFLQANVSSLQTRIATDHAQYAYAAWLNSGLWVAISTDSGATYGTPIQLSTLPIQPDYFDIAAVSRGRGVYVVFTHLEDGHRQLYFSASHDRGSTWTPAAKIPMGAEDGHFPSIAAASIVGVAQDQVVVTYGQGVIYAASSANGGSTWTAGHVVISTSPLSAQAARIAISGLRVHMAFEVADLVSGASRIYYSNSDDLGQTFGSPVAISSNPPELEHRAGAPSLAAEGMVVGVVWTDLRDNPGSACRSGEAYMARSVNGGATFLPDQRMTHTEGCRGFCSCVGDALLTTNESGLSVLVWNELVDSIFFGSISAAASGDFGATFGMPNLIVSEPLIQYAGGLASDGNRVFLGRMEQDEFSGPMDAFADLLTCQ